MAGALFLKRILSGDEKLIRDLRLPQEEDVLNTLIKSAQKEGTSQFILELISDLAVQSGESSFHQNFLEVLQKQKNPYIIARHFQNMENSYNAHYLLDQLLPFIVPELFGQENNLTMWFRGIVFKDLIDAETYTNAISPLLRKQNPNLYLSTTIDFLSKKHFQDKDAGRFFESVLNMAVKNDDDKTQNMAASFWIQRAKDLYPTSRINAENRFFAELSKNPKAFLKISRVFLIDKSKKADPFIFFCDLLTEPSNMTIIKETLKTPEHLESFLSLFTDVFTGDSEIYLKRRALHTLRVLAQSDTQNGTFQRHILKSLSQVIDTVVDPESRKMIADAYSEIAA